MFAIYFSRPQARKIWWKIKQYLTVSRTSAEQICQNPRGFFYYFIGSKYVYFSYIFHLGSNCISRASHISCLYMLCYTNYYSIIQFFLDALIMYDILRIIKDLITKLRQANSLHLMAHIIYQKSLMGFKLICHSAALNINLTEIKRDRSL